MEKSNRTGEYKRPGLVREAIVPIGSLIIALAGIVLSYQSLVTQIWLKQSEVKYMGYGVVMGELHMAFYKPRGGQISGDHLNKAFAEYYLLETFIKSDKRGELRNNFVSVILACEKAEEVRNNPKELIKMEEIFNSRHKILGAKLEEALKI